MSILTAQDISKSYKLRKVVKDLSLEMKSGEVVGLLGPNGAGKTTAFYMIVGLVTADSGRKRPSFASSQLNRTSWRSLRTVTI